MRWWCGPIFHSIPGRKPRLGEAKNSLVKVLKCCSRSSLGLSKRLQIMVAKYLEIKNLSHLFPKGVPDQDWYYGFVKRNPFLRLKVAAPKKISCKNELHLIRERPSAPAVSPWRRLSRSKDRPFFLFCFLLKSFTAALDLRLLGVPMTTLFVTMITRTAFYSM